MQVLISPDTHIHGRCECLEKTLLATLTQTLLQTLVQTRHSCVACAMNGRLHVCSPHPPAPLVRPDAMNLMCALLRFRLVKACWFLSSLWLNIGINGTQVLLEDLELDTHLSNEKRTVEINVPGK